MRTSVHSRSVGASLEGTVFSIIYICRKKRTSGIGSRHLRKHDRVSQEAVSQELHECLILNALMLGMAQGAAHLLAHIESVTS